MWSRKKDEQLKSAGALATRRSVLVALLTAPLLTACGGGFQPLYGPSLGGGGSVGGTMAAVDVGLIPGRVGQVVRNELVFKTTGGAEPEPPKYRLEIAMRQSAQNLLVTLAGESTGLMYGLDADFSLVRIEDNQVLLTAKAQSRAAYQKVESVYANVRARRDAEDRAARILADSIRTRVAAFISSGAA